MIIYPPRSARVRRPLFGATALAVVLTACGSGAEPEPANLPSVSSRVTDPEPSATVTPPETDPQPSQPSNPAPTSTDQIDAPAVTNPAPGHSVPATGSPTDPQLSTPLTPTQYDLASKAAGDLAERRLVEIAEITVVSVEEVTWPDASLGCPQKGLQSAQVLTPGIQIMLELDGKSVAYHGGAGRDPFYCATPQAPTGS